MKLVEANGLKISRKLRLEIMRRLLEEYYEYIHSNPFESLSCWLHLEEKKVKEKGAK